MKDCLCLFYKNDISFYTSKLFSYFCLPLVFLPCVSHSLEILINVQINSVLFYLYFAQCFRGAYLFCDKIFIDDIVKGINDKFFCSMLL